jgi:hypothetical protein
LRSCDGPSAKLAKGFLEIAQVRHEDMKVALVFSTRRLTSAIKSLAPGGGRRLQNLSHSSDGARSAKAEDGITNGPLVTATMRPSKIWISQAVGPTSSRKVVVR